MEKPKPRNRRGVIYFIEAEGLNRLKIGFSEHLVNRMRVLQNSSPVSLRLLKTVRGDLNTEQVLLSVFKLYNVHHEWFELKPLKGFVDSLVENSEFSPEMLLKK